MPGRSHGGNARAQLTVVQLHRRAVAAPGGSGFNPAENDDGGTRRSRAFHLKLDIPALLQLEAVVLLPGWEGLRGANPEVWITIDLDVLIHRCLDADETVGLGRIEGLQIRVLPFCSEPALQDG